MEAVLDLPQVEKPTRHRGEHLFRKGDDPRRAKQGRAKGTPNHVTTECKAIIEQAFSGAGGIEALTAWAIRKPDLFYCHVWTKIIPKDIHVTGSIGIAQLFMDAGKLIEAQAKARELDSAAALPLLEGKATVLDVPPPAAAPTAYLDPLGEF